MPPVSRLEESSQTRRCTRLRHALRRALDALFEPHYQAYQLLKPHAVGLDLEKYFDIYEISRTDLEDIELIAKADPSDLEAADSLNDLKGDIHKFHIARKLVLCTLLAIDADGGKVDFIRWPKAIETMQGLTRLTFKVAAHVDELLCKEQGGMLHKMRIFL